MPGDAGQGRVRPRSGSGRPRTTADESARLGRSWAVEPVRVSASTGLLIGLDVSSCRHSKPACAVAGYLVATLSRVAGQLRICSLNISSPSPARAGEQVGWLQGRGEDVFVLTETRPGKGHDRLIAGLADAGLCMLDSEPGPTGRGVLIASRLRLEREPNDPFGALDGRALRCRIATSRGPLSLVGVYAPSSPPEGIRLDPAKLDRKRDWLARFVSALAGSAPAATGGVYIGDFNVIQSDHVPRYRSVQQFEYDFYRDLITRFGLVDCYQERHVGCFEHSWVNHNGDPYRFDYAFCSSRLGEYLIDCSYDHGPRESRLTDHSAVTMTLDLEPTERAELAGAAFGQEVLF